jgi:hypothetical protein
MYDTPIYITASVNDDAEDEMTVRDELFMNHLLNEKISITCPQDSIEILEFNECVKKKIPFHSKIAELYNKKIEEEEKLVKHIFKMVILSLQDKVMRKMMEKARFFIRTPNIQLSKLLEDAQKELEEEKSNRVKK